MKQLRNYINIRKKPSTVVAEDDTIFNIVKDGITKFGKDANLNYIDTSRCTNFDSLFYKCFFNNIEDVNPDVSDWNVSNVYNFSFCFCVSAFNGDLSKWDMSSAQNLNSMFNECHKFEGIGLEYWADSLSNTVNAAYMFRETLINGKQLEKWKFSKNMQYVHKMFSKCKKLDCDLSDWDLSWIRKEQYSEMLTGCKLMYKKPDVWPHVKYVKDLFNPKELKSALI